MPTTTYSDREAVEALVSVLGSSNWQPVCYAKGYMRLLEGASAKDSARVCYEHGNGTPSLRESTDLMNRIEEQGLLRNLTKRERVGSAENPITKLFPATITERRFIDLLEELCGARPSLTYSDDRLTGHTLVDFIIHEGDGEDLPVNIKNAGTPFNRARDLVGLDPEDCIPIPAYKANAAVEAVPNLLYVVSVDYDLLSVLDDMLPKLLTRDEMIAWDLLNKYAGARVRSAEDVFVTAMVSKYWDQLSFAVSDSPFHVVSARKAIRILQTKPHRTPGIGLRAWGTGASAEVNVHISIREETKPWQEIADRIRLSGIQDIVKAVNRRKVEEVYDPEI